MKSSPSFVWAGSGILLAGLLATANHRGAAHVVPAQASPSQTFPSQASPSQSAPSAQAPTATLPPMPVAQNPPQAPLAPRYLILLDPAHGGQDIGARLSDHVLEKDIDLALSFRLRSLLAARGFTVITTRDTDAGTAPTADQRADIANHARPMACVLLHASASGNGIHIFTSSLSIPPADQLSQRRNAFIPWDAAQAAYLPRSLRLAAEVNSAFNRAEIPVTLSRTYLRPLDNLTCPAIAVEAAPFTATGSSDTLDLSNSAYQQRVAESLAWALVEWRMHTTGAFVGAEPGVKPGALPGAQPGVKPGVKLGAQPGAQPSIRVGPARNPMGESHP